MSKVVFVLELPEPKIRKKQAPPSKRHKDTTKYSRKQKHKAKREEAPGELGAFFYSAFITWIIPHHIVQKPSIINLKYSPTE